MVNLVLSVKRESWGCANVKSSSHNTHEHGYENYISRTSDFQSADQKKNGGMKTTKGTHGEPQG